MASPDLSVDNVLPKLLDWISAGQRVCLATLYHAQGASPRPVGSQMAIAEDGQWFGYLSGGCAEQAIADEGIAVIESQQSRSVRYGLGSPYLDIQLPCGAGIDVWFEQDINTRVIQQILDTQVSRSPANWQCSVSESTPSAELDTSESFRFFRRWYTPSRRLYIIGAGPNVPALAKLAMHSDYVVEVFTPDALTYADVASLGVKVERLVDQTQIDDLTTDPWTSAVIMFHEHERETQILHTLLRSDVVYLGALGSQRTHAVRLGLLKEGGASNADCARIHGPIGLDINAKTPMEIAISVLAELTIEYQAVALPLLELDDNS